jgi:uroporphyrin-III C-methyltransferase
MSGKVWLVGAGPGDPELLTLKAVKALQAAQVILCDDLVHDDVLAYANPRARVVRVGKRGGKASTSQKFIIRLMIAEARSGLVVVRLKGGDPMIFGRGGEECAALAAAGIAFEVVNGITSGLAAATSLGIPLTHRDLCHGVALVTGTENDWPALAKSGLPLVIYMGVSHAGDIAEALMAAGMAPDTPAAAIANATRAEQLSVVTSLKRLELEMTRAGIASPAVLVIGAIAGLASVARSEVLQEIQQGGGG